MTCRRRAATRIPSWRRNAEDEEPKELRCVINPITSISWGAKEGSLFAGQDIQEDGPGCDHDGTLCCTRAAPAAGHDGECHWPPLGNCEAAVQTCRGWHPLRFNLSASSVGVEGEEKA